MNQANVDALTLLVEAVLREHSIEGPNGPIGENWWEPEDFTSIAEMLASRGVLVPSTLTNLQVNLIPYDIHLNPHQFVGALEEIAKGVEVTA